MELTVFRRDAPVGTLRVEEAGLYRILDARIGSSPEILRLYLDGKSFGVFCPEAGGLALRRRVSRALLPEMPDRAVAWCPADGAWTPEGCGLVRFTPAGPARAIRWRTDGPMDFPSAPGSLRAFLYGEKYYLAINK